MSNNNWSKYLINKDTYTDLSPTTLAQHLSGAIKYNTVSYFDTSLMLGDEFTGLHKYFEEIFPLLHTIVEKTIINRWSLLYKWSGTDKTKKPILFMSHLDVVPVAEETLNTWIHGPFSGDIADGLVWGRGTIDTKSYVVAQLEAAEYLITNGFTPECDIYFCFGHDEESMGPEGSNGIMEHLKSQGVELLMVVDEGGKIQPGEEIGAPDILIGKVGVFEKGYADISIIAKQNGGHSSCPDNTTAVGDVCRAVVAIEDNKLPPSICEPLKNYYKAIAPYLTVDPIKTYASDIEKYNDELIAYHLQDKKTANLVRTSTAATMLSGSPAPNILAQQAEAVFNFRTHVTESCQDIVNHCKKSANNPNLEITLIKGLEPSKISNSTGMEFKALEEVMQMFFKDIIAVPNMVAGGTDARYFEDICPCCFRFRPFIDQMEFGHTVHADNERCSIESYVHGVKFIIEMMKKLSSI